MQACLKYIKTKFARTMLGVLKPSGGGEDTPLLARHWDTSASS